MFLFLPVLFLFFCTLVALRYVPGWRESFLIAAVLAGTLLTAITEILSLMKSFSFYPLMAAWLFLTGGAVCFVWNVRRSIPRPQINVGDWSLSEKILLGFIVFIGFITAITAYVGAPNTWDSMTYHLSRVAHWIQDKTVSFYPTHILRQLYSSPWAEYAVAHLRILGGGQTSPNFVQWTSMAGSLVAASLIAQQLGAGRRGQLLAAALAACLPMGILQSVSTQTDYAASFWLIGFVYFLIEGIRKFSLVRCIAIGLSLGLAFLTKGYEYVLVLPFLAWFLTGCLKQSFSRSLTALALVMLCVLGLNMGQYWRNARAFGSPQWTDVSLTNASFGPRVLWVNVLRNAAIQLATPFEDADESIQQGMTRAAQWLGADINDPRASFTSNFSVPGLSFDEDYAGNFLHSILFIIIFVACWFYRENKNRVRSYVLCVLTSFLLFCLIVRFSPWNVRFHLPLYILFCPVAGTVTEYFLKQKSIAVAALFFLAAGPWMFLDHEHPWFGHRSIWRVPQPAQYFYKHADLALPYAQSAGYIKSTGCRRVGLLLGADSWEYPWWVLLGPGVRIEHVGVKNRSMGLRYPAGDFDACVIIAEGTGVPVIMEGSSLYGLAGRTPGGLVSIYKKMESI
ncbi:MAG: glycosyltransferase family 39 protein [Candidatus Omnitrophica bacterium]|nr:glycosyltransferase family 39 protein [Candidatus Omnitrophota bacterium]